MMRARTSPRQLMQLRERAFALSAALACFALFPESQAASGPRILALVIGLPWFVASRFWQDSKGCKLHLAPSPALFASMWLAWVGCGVAYGGGSGMLDCATWAGGALFAATGIRLGSRSAARVASLFATCVGAGASVWATLQLAQHHAPTGITGNPDWLGLLVAPCLGIAVDAALHARGCVRKFVYSISVIIMSIGLALSHSRVAWVAVLCAGMLVGVRQLARTQMPGAVAGVGVPVAVVNGPASSNGYTDAAWHASLADRSWIWQHSLRAALEKPLFGHGTGRFAQAYLPMQGRSLALLNAGAASKQFINATSAHSNVLHTLVENGAVGLLLLVGFFASALIRAYRGANGFLFAWITLALSCFGDVPLHLPSIAILVGLLVAALPRSAKKTAPINPRASYIVHAAAIAGGALALMLVWNATRAYASERLRVHAATATGEHRRRLLMRALAFAPHDGEALFELGLAESEAAEWALAATHLADSQATFANVGTYVARGNASLGLHDYVSANKDYRAALALDKGSLKAHVNLSEGCRMQRDLVCATNELAEAKRIAPYHPKVVALEERLETDVLDDRLDDSSN